MEISLQALVFSVNVHVASKHCSKPKGTSKKKTHDQIKSVFTWGGKKVCHLRHEYNRDELTQL